MEKIIRNKPVKIKKYMYEFAQEMGIGPKNKSIKQTKKENTKGTT